MVSVARTIPSKFLAMKSERESGEYCLVVLWKRNARVDDIYIYIRVEILKFSCRQPPVCRGAAPITLSAYSSTYPPVSCPRYFSSSFRRRRDTWERCAPAHTIDFICVHTVTYSQRGLVSPSRIDTQTSLSLSLSFSLFLLFSRARCAQLLQR